VGKVSPSLCTANPLTYLEGLLSKALWKLAADQPVALLLTTWKESCDRGAALVGPSNNGLEVGHGPPNHEKRGLEPLVRCWPHHVFTRKS